MSNLQAIHYMDVKNSECNPAQEQQEETNPSTQNEKEAIQKFRDQVSLINKGFVVYVSEVGKSIEKDSHFLVKVTLLSTVNGMQVFGEEVQLKFAKQTLNKLKSEITRAT